MSQVIPMSIADVQGCSQTVVRYRPAGHETVSCALWVDRLNRKSSFQISVKSTFGPICGPLSNLWPVPWFNSTRPNKGLMIWPQFYHDKSLKILAWYTLKSKHASQCHRRTFSSNWFHKEPLTSEEPFFFTKGSLWRKEVLQIIKRTFDCMVLCETKHGYSMASLWRTF